MSMRIAGTKFGGGRTILPLRKGRDRTWPLPRLGRLAGRAARPPQAAAWEPALRHGDRQTPCGRLTGAPECCILGRGESVTRLHARCTPADWNGPIRDLHIAAVGHEMQPCRKMMRDTANVFPTFLRLTSSYLLYRKKLRPISLRVSLDSVSY